MRKHYWGNLFPCLCVQATFIVETKCLSQKFIRGIYLFLFMQQMFAMHTNGETFNTEIIFPCSQGPLQLLIFPFDGKFDHRVQTATILI